MSNKTKTTEELKVIKYLPSDKIIIKRFPRPEKTESGLILPSHYKDEKQEVGHTAYMNKYLHVGEVVAVGPDCEFVELGDVVHILPAAYDLFYVSKMDPEYLATNVEEVNNPYVMTSESYGIEFVEHTEVAEVKE